jgi:tetratricopeptide (TPR) repeat protein
VRARTHKITDRELLLEALAQVPDAGYINEEVFEQQATQGYYDDALATARLASKKDDLYRHMFELAKIRTENGDLQGAKNMVKMFPDAAFQTGMIKSIALTQAHQGEISGALETCSPLNDCDEILLEFSRYQIAHADFQGALATAERLTRPSDVFYEIGDALRLRGEQKRAHVLASGMSNRKLAALFLKIVRFTMWHHPEAYVLRLSACDMAYEDAMHNQFAKAVKALEQNHCQFHYTAIPYYEIDPAAAEKLMRSSTDPYDLRFGLPELAIAAAKKGRIEDALQLRADAKKVDPKESYNSTLEIALAWAKRDGPCKVLPWARSQPTPGDRMLALLGMAQALGHKRPHQPEYPLIH